MASPSLEEVRGRLAGPGLATTDLFSCADALAELARDALAAGRPVRRVALAGDLTLDFLERAIRCSIALEGELVVLHSAGFGALRQACVDSRSALHAFRPDCVVLVPDWRACVPVQPPDTSPGDVAAWLEEEVRAHEALWSALEPLGCPVIEHLLVAPQWRWRGVAERLLPAGLGRRVDALNHALLQASAARITWVEMDRLAESIGLAAWAPERFYQAGRLPFDPRHLPAYLPWFRAAWRCAVGTARKVLVLDLDDTLWGGAIGEEGVEGIVLGPQGGPRGEAFAEWQRYLAQLAARGVALAVCSKNAPELAMAGFSHAAGALRRSDFGAFVCSWQDKAAGLRQVAQEMDLGLQALVFADDSPTECALVRQLLPQVAVVNLGRDPSRFIDVLEEGHWFDLSAFTPADFRRSSSYAARSQARASRSDAADLATFLRGLDMTGRVVCAQPADLARLAQMELKTNQFNLTTRRIPHADLARWLQDPARMVLTLHLRDRFGDHGLVGSLAAVHEGEAVRIESWLLSCRVFARTAEQFMLAQLARRAIARGATALIGEYRPTQRNGVVADLFQRLGFVVDESAPGFWRRSLDTPLDDLGSFISEASEGPLRAA